MTSGSVQPASVRGFELDVVEGPGSGKHWESSEGRCTIGSHQSCELMVEDSTVSRFHCEIIVDQSGPRVRDLDSRNGTIVDGVRVLGAYLRGGSLLRLGRTVARFQLAGKRNQLPLSGRERFGVMVGQSSAMRMTFAVLERAAASNATVLLEGETGTGKSAAARSLHMESARSAGPFVMLDCGSIPANLLESELFGHEKGAYTGAAMSRIGAFEEASGGTIFLDEIGEMPPELQPKLLSVLENREIRRLGSNAQRPVDLRVVAATNRDLRAEVNAGRFREDLYYRIAVVKIALPPLRQRPDDLPGLASTLLAQLGAPPERIAGLMTEELIGSMRRAAWPGNIRELRNYLERCLVFDEPLPADVSSAADAPHHDHAQGDTIRIDAGLPFAEARQRALSEIERAYISEVLRQNDGKVSHAAAQAGIDRTYFYRLLRRHGLK
jgi:DNA-binding NtrC family response regulator